MARHNPLKETGRLKRLNRRFPLKEALIAAGVIVAAVGLIVAGILLFKHVSPVPAPSAPTATGTNVIGTDPTTDLPATRTTDTRPSVTQTESNRTTAAQGTNTDTGTDLPTVPQEEDPLLVRLAKEAFDGARYKTKHIVVLDCESGTVLYQKNANDSIVAASTTKLLTALTAVDYISENSTFTVGSELSLVGAYSSTAHLKKGQTLTAGPILDAMLLPSGNDAAYVIAVHVGRTLNGDPECSDKEALNTFLSRMNEKAAALGAENSLFTCPDGYPGGKQHTTASDMAKIAAAALKDPMIAASCAKPYVSYELADGTTLEWSNTNLLIQPSSPYYYEDAVGMKTGYTEAAGQCVVGAARADGHTVLVAIYNAPTAADRWNDCRDAFVRAFSALRAAREGSRPAA